MTIEYLKEFLILAEIKNFSAAADELFMSQASLSRHIIAMENELNRKLFHRTSKEVELTNAGIKLLPFADHIVKLQRQYENIIKENLAQFNENLSIGLYRKTNSDDIDNVINDFRSNYPNITVEIEEDYPRELKNSLRHGKYDIIIFIGVNFIENEKYNNHDFFSRELSRGSTDIILLINRSGKAKTSRQLFIQFVELFFN